MTECDGCKALPIDGPDFYCKKCRAERVRPIGMTGDSDFDSMIGSCIDILKVKGADYTMGKSDPLHNFKMCAEFTGLTPQQVLGVYLYKHVAAIYAHINNKTESEPIEGRIADVINYMLLYTKMVRGR